ncbi:hypothetical protein [Nitrosopumilus maritimus]|uniref:Uncharacterized protein n=1 Tax=Nitrosopumilus maritimus (strain SCM1) TaxID=436308 RepID=A9A5V7_NITMS|nr:hypothetical protein [Nitrosopumilus maritimus]ABX13112.1 hypothetical protein Nmar_1216 [Nitrosopumilus maritimus SCM1]
MRKPYSDETRNDIVEKYLLGESVREIHDSTGVSTGSISEYINDFTSKIERKTIDAIHDFFKIIRKNGMQPKDAFYGHVVFSILLKHNLDPKQIHSFVESVLSMAKQNELSPEHLVGLCNTISKIQSKSDVPLHEIENHCTELVKTKNELELSIDKLSDQHKQSQNNLSALLKKNKLTEQQVEKITQTLEFLEKSGFDLSDADSVCNVLQNVKSQEYDIAKIISYLSKDESVDLRLNEKQSKLDEVEKKTGNLEKKYKELSLKHENLLLRHKSMAESISSVENLTKSGVLEQDLISWQKIFDSFEMAPKEFLEELEKAGNAKKLFRKLNSVNSKLKKENESLEKKKLWLESHNDEIKLEISNGTEFAKNNLNDISKHAKSELNSVVSHTEDKINKLVKQNKIQADHIQKQHEEYLQELIHTFETHLKHSHKIEHTLGKLESLKPLFDLVNGKFDPIASIGQIITLLDKIYVGIKGTEFDKHSISYDIKRLRENLLKVISHE